MRPRRRLESDEPGFLQLLRVNPKRYRKVALTYVHGVVP